ncbi:bifunctional chorismate mutase/prephenate dehydrogenase [Candidatus Annandia pinicola]|uniref:bifunctional chorismate mutase/prephenate dehydrogenase n=1 Tax=Candidatus Annandia pinicola TaxID=1345117 RepID=UPI001D02DDBF|nr:bifunctional chorismate mutase/prephenate dehydrogenase [Candidatus Annandia pinicola]UDG80432.1 T-protein [Candidatus Annandia pinicola]
MDLILSEILFFRNKIDIVDESIINLVHKRLILVSKVGKIKSKCGIPIYIPERELSLLNSRRLIAEELKLPKGLIEDLMKRIMYESYLREYSHGFKKVNKNIKSIVIINDNNCTGILFKKMLKLSNYKVYFFNSKEIDKINNIKFKIDMVIISVSNKTLKEIMLFIINLPKKCILVNLNIISYERLKLILYIHKGPVLLLQPKFNSNAYHITKETIFYYNGRNMESYKWFLNQIKIWGVILKKITNIKNNKDIMFIDFLKFFFYFIYGLDLVKNKKLSSSLNFLPIPYDDFNLKDISLFFKNNLDLYIDNILSNKENKKIFIEDYLEKITKIIDLIKNNKELFLKKIEEIKEYFK